MLSPDSENVLEDFDLENSIYIIGGLVDRTVKAKETFQRANEIGITSMRLPLKETIYSEINPFKFKKVLNMNTVVEILHTKASGLSWKETFLSCIPNRWLKKI